MPFWVRLIPPGGEAAHRGEYQATAACEGCLHNPVISRYNGKHMDKCVCVHTCASLTHSLYSDVMILLLEMCLHSAENVL